MIKASSNRNYGIDTLKIISMFFVVILHCLRGGVLQTINVHTPQYYVSWFLEIFAYCAVDVFALVTGYVSYREKERKNIFTNYIVLWLEVVFYSLIITLILNVFYPSLIGKKMYFNSLFPVLTCSYWYFTAYTGVVLMMPILDNALRTKSKTYMKKLFILIIGLFILYGILRDGYGLNGGYSVFWLLILYVLGGIIKKCNLFSKISSKKIVLLMTFLFASTFIYKCLDKKFIIADITFTDIFATNYTSPTILGIAILYLVLFSRINFSEKAKKIVNYFAPTTFAVYILNSNMVINMIFLKDRFRVFSHFSAIKLFGSVIAFCLSFVLASMLIDRIRIWIFKKLNINSFAKKVETFLERIMKNLLKLLA